MQSVNTSKVKISFQTLVSLVSTYLYFFPITFFAYSSFLKSLNHFPYFNSFYKLENSKQEFKSNVIGNNKCFGHVECDAIIKDNAKVIAVPEIIANNVGASVF